jgi:hypothetical protein
MEESTSVFQTKYDEFVEDLLGALPEYTSQIQEARALDHKSRVTQFQDQVKIGDTFASDDFSVNPCTILPGVNISNDIWSSLTENTKKAIWEYVKILSMCSFMETGFSDDAKPSWMEDAMNDMKKKLEGVDFQNILKKFMTFFKNGEGKEGEDSGAIPEGIPAGFEKMFENGFPKIPEKFLKGHMAKLAQEIVKDITPEDLGISPEMIADCEKNPSRAFDILFQVFGSNPGNIQNIVQKIGKRLQQKIISGAIRPQEIAREAEELMKEFAGNSSFVDMMDGIKGAFGFEDMDLAKQAGRESSARLSMVKDRLRKKASEKEARKVTSISSNSLSVLTAAQAEANAIALLNEENNKKSKKKIQGNGGKK